MLGPERGIVEAGRDGMGLADHSALVLEYQSTGAMEHPHGRLGRAAGVSPGSDAEPPGFDSHLAHRRLVEERMEQADRVAAAAHARHQDVGEPSHGAGELRARLDPDHALEVTNQGGKRVRPEHRAQHVVGVVDARHPVAQRLVDRVLEGTASRLHLAHLGAEQLHALDVQMLAARILDPHVDRAGEPAACRGRRGGHAVLACAGFGDHARLAHATRQQALADRVVDLVGAGVQQVLALEEHAGVRGLGELRREHER